MYVYIHVYPRNGVCGGCSELVREMLICRGDDVCICVYSCVCIYICEHVHTYMHTYVHTYMDGWTRDTEHEYTQSIKMHAYSHTHTMHTHIHTYTQHAYIHTHTYTCIHIHAYIYMHTYTCIYTCRWLDTPVKKSRESPQEIGANITQGIDTSSPQQEGVGRNSANHTPVGGSDRNIHVDESESDESDLESPLLPGLSWYIYAKYTVRWVWVRWKWLGEPVAACAFMRVCVCMCMYVLYIYAKYT